MGDRDGLQKGLDVGTEGETGRKGRAIPRDLAREIRLVILDVDGVLTDAGIYVGALPDGANVELKRFDIQDGVGVKLLQAAGLDVAIVSGRVSRATAIRAAELGISECHQDGGAQKLPAIRKMMEARGLEWSQVAMIGDDIPDLAVLRRVGLPAAVGNATREVAEIALWQARKTGGRGAVREFCEALLHARGEWDEQVESYVGARSGEGES